MADSEFSIYIHHGGKMLSENGELIYNGVELAPRHGLDIDRFGYFDLEEEVHNLGYKKWNKLFYNIPWTKTEMKEVFDDAGVMDMIKQSTYGQYLVSVYVDGGKLNCDDDGVAVTDEVDGTDGVVGPDFLNDNIDDFLGDISGYSSEDEDYMPIDVSESDDGLSCYDLETDDEEYIIARKNMASDRSESNWGAIINYEIEESEGLHSDYEDSEGEVNSDSTNSDGEFVDEGRKKKNMIIYDQKCDHKQLNFMLGMRFESKKQCSSAIQRQAIVHGYNIQFTRTNAKQVEARCVDGCPWKLYASLISKEETFAIKHLIHEHSCSRDMRTRQATARWIANEYIENFRKNPNWSIDDLAFDLLKNYAISPSRWKLYRGKWMALELLRGSINEHYASLRSYMAALLESDNEGRFEFLLGDDSVFKGFFVGFSALKKGFLQGCRPIIGFDGCFLKTFLGGALLCATGKDGNNQMFPIAWAVVETENESCWRWFLTILFEELGISDGLGWTFVSDQQKGLIKAISELTPYAEHRNCARHIYINWKKNFKGKTLKNIFWKCVRSTYMGDYNIALQEMKEENEAAYKGFLERDPQRFCKTFISTIPRSDMIDNNVSETFNGYIVKARGKHIVDMLETIRSELMERQHRNLQDMSGVTDKICPRIRKKVEAAKYWSRMCITKPAVGERFQVSVKDDQFVVDLKYSTCTCRAWELTGIPCIHACSAIHFMKKDVADFVDQCYTVTVYIVAYQNALQPLNGRKLWPGAAGNPIKPPPFRKMPGRPKKKRRRGPEEEKKNARKLKRFGLQMTCQKCFKIGHNKRSCTNEAAEKPQKRKRGRPRMDGSTSCIRKSRASTSEIPQSTQTDNAIASALHARDRAVARKGFGIHVGGEAGNIYMRMPEENRVHFVASTYVGSSSSSSRGRRGRGRMGTRASSRITHNTGARDIFGTQESAAK